MSFRRPGLGLALALTLSACNTASFKGNSAKRASGIETAIERGGPEVDCTGLGEKQCLDKREENHTDKSFRTVDCSAQADAACDKTVNETKVVDGSAGSEIRVTRCQKPDGCATGDGGDKTGDDGKTIGDGGGEIALGDIKYCAGGPVNAVFPFRTEDEAAACYDNIRKGGSVNASKNCASDARYGKCSYKGTLDAARKARSPAAKECECLRTDIAIVPGLSWDGIPKTK